MSSKPDRSISILIEELLEREVPKGTPVQTELKIRFTSLKNQGGLYKKQPHDLGDVLSALTSAAAITLSGSDDLIEEAMENAVAFCNSVLQQTAKMRRIDPDEIEWRNRH